MRTDRYRGDGKPPEDSARPAFPYVADPALARAVNIAIVLGRPLLVKGPPGCGKSRLANGIAAELELPLYRWHIKSTSRAQDGLYSIDMVRRLQDAQAGDKRAQLLTPYIRFGPLGEAICGGSEAVVLIDEIDKADIDFPNDLLRELEEMAFTIEELDERELSNPAAVGFKKNYRTEHRPIVVITSNDEKELPDAFLRRCLFHYIEFPKKEHLRRIVELNTPGLDLEARLVERAVDRLNEIRKIGGFRKEPATSELIDWVKVLHYWGVHVAEIDAGQRLTNLPYWQALFKHLPDAQRLEREAESLAAAAPGEGAAP